MPVNQDEIEQRLITYAAEFHALTRQRPRRDLLLNGDGTRHGLNHLNELVMMLSDSGQSKEFRIRE